MILTSDLAHYVPANSRKAPAALPTEGDQEKVYLPTEEEIAAECKRIREGWSKNEQHRRRAGVTAEDYSEE